MLEYDHLRLQKFLTERVDLRLFCYVLKNKLRTQYAYQNLRGEIPAEKSITLIEIAEKNSEIGELVYQLVSFWLQRDSNAQVLTQEGLDRDLALFQQELSDRPAEAEKAAHVAALLGQIAPLDRPERGPDVSRQPNSDPPDQRTYNITINGPTRDIIIAGNEVNQTNNSDDKEP